MSRLSRRHIGSLVSLLVLLGRPLPSAAIDPLEGTRLTVLPNGLRLVHREHRSAPLVAIDVWVRAGSGKESATERGAAHLLEHMLFKGTPTRKPGEIDAAIEDLGSTLSAGTTRDAAHFFTTVASEHAASALEVLGDAMRNSVLDPAEFERERAVIIDELARAENDGPKQALNALYAALFPDEPFGQPVLGTRESIRAISRDRVMEFYRSWYAPNNVTVVLVGDITAEKAQELVSAHFGGWEKRELPPALERALPLPIPAGDPAGGRYDRIALGIRMGAAAEKTRDAVGLVTARLLADSGFGRLPAIVRPAAAPQAARRPSRARTETTPRDNPEFSVEFISHPHSGVLAVNGAHISERDALSAVREALTSLRKEAPTEAELDYARRRTLGAFLFSVETYAGQARALGDADVNGDYQDAVELANRVARVTQSDVNAFAAQWLDPARVGTSSAPARTSP